MDVFSLDKHSCKEISIFLNNITQLELSKLTGLKQPAIARIEKQVNSVTLTTLITIIDELDLKLELVPKR